jgi:hypothetical protein
MSGALKAVSETGFPVNVYPIWADGRYTPIMKKSAATRPFTAIREGPAAMSMRREGADYSSAARTGGSSPGSSPPGRGLLPYGIRVEWGGQRKRGSL